MKKLSIVFLLLFALTCMMFASCNDSGNESSATDSTASVASSEAESSKAEASSEAESSEAEDSSEAESSEAEESSEDESSEDESSEDETSAPAEVSNIAKGKKYSVTGCGTGYVYLEGQYPSKYDANLTDGAVSNEINYGVDSTWFGFYYKDDASAAIINAPDGKGSVTIDLGSKATLTKVRLHLANANDSGVKPPKSITVYVSNNNSSFTKYGTVKVSKDDGVYWAEVSKNTSARYVKIEFELDGVFAFLDEVEVLGA